MSSNVVRLLSGRLTLPRCIASLCFLFLLLLVPVALVSAQSKATVGAPAAPKPRRTHFEMAVQTSLSNVYKVGNVDPWFEEITVPGESLTDMAPGFNQFDIRMIRGTDSAAMRFGIGISAYKGSPQAFNGQSVEAKTQFAATPRIFSFTFPFQARLGAGSNTYVTVEPAVGFAVAEGYLSQSTSRVTLDADPTPGYQLGIGIDRYMGLFAISGRVGYRKQTFDVGYRDADGTLKQYILRSTGAWVIGDLSGSYATLGFALVL